MATSGVGFSEYGRMRGWSQPYVSKLVKQGKIPKDALTRDGKIIPAKADAAIAAVRDPSRRHIVERNARARANGNATVAETSAPILPADTGFQRARTLRETFTARISQIEYERLIGKLARVEDFEAAHADKLASARDELLGIADRIAARLAATNEISECWRIVDEAIRLAMRHIASRPATRTGLTG